MDVHGDHIPYEEVYDDFVHDTDPNAAPPDTSVPEGDDTESTDGSSTDGTIESEGEVTPPVAPNEGVTQNTYVTWLITRGIGTRRTLIS